MKNFAFSLLLICLAFTVHAQTVVPLAVRQAFAEKFPMATDIAWETEDEAFEVEFKLSDTSMEATFDAEGNWLATETDLETSDLPGAVRRAVKAQFPDYEIEEAELLATPEWERAFSLELKKDDAVIEAIFDPKGKLLRQETEEAEGEEGGSSH